MKLIQRKDIDPVKWDVRIKESAIENIFCYTWYLDTVSENWWALVSEDYQTIIPLPFVSRFGMKQIYQPPFTREIDVFGQGFKFEDTLPIMEENFRHIAFRNREILALPFTERIYQVIELDDEFKARYRTNAKRLIKKAEKAEFKYVSISKPKELIDIFKKTVARKIDSIRPADLVTLEKLMFTAMSIDLGELIGIQNTENKIVGAGFFLKDKKRITYLKGACFEQEKKQGAMFGLMNFALDKYASTHDTFDFGGSDIEDVATFYKKFGASDSVYYAYEIDNLPNWYKKLKKLKKK